MPLGMRTVPVDILGQLFLINHFQYFLGNIFRGALGPSPSSPGPQGGSGGPWGPSLGPGPHGALSGAQWPLLMAAANGRSEK